MKKKVEQIEQKEPNILKAQNLDGIVNEHGNKKLREVGRAGNEELHIICIKCKSMMRITDLKFSCPECGGQKVTLVQRAYIEIHYGVDEVNLNGVG